MTQEEREQERLMRAYVKRHPKSIMANFYRLGRKDKELELQPEIDKLSGRDK